jgi:MFS family permease
MSSGPAVAALTGVPAGRFVDRFGAHRMIIVGLIGMAVGSSILPAAATGFGVPGYVAPLAVITAGYALFQAANNAAVMTGIRSGDRDLISGMLNLSRNLGLITSTSIMGTVFAIGAATTDVMSAGAGPLRTA